VVIIRKFNPDVLREDMLNPAEAVWRRQSRMAGDDVNTKRPGAMGAKAKSGYSHYADIHRGGHARDGRKRCFCLHATLSQRRSS
jgi:hypothetical protein